MIKLFIFSFVCFATAVNSMPILSVTGLGGGGSTAAGSSHGWTFIVNQDFWVTDLGLYDSYNDGFDISHDIGLYRQSDNSLLTFGTLSAGTSNTLLNHFRYVDTADVKLNAGENYIISYFSSSANNDWVSTSSQGLVIDPLVTILNGNWGRTNGLSIPTNITSSDRIGPNFLYSSSIASVPEPSSLALLLIGLLAFRLRKWG